MNDEPLSEGRRAPDLDPSEEAVAARFAALTRHQAPTAVRSALHAQRESAARRPGHLLRFPLGAWGVASAALLLLALGGAAYVEISNPVTISAPLTSSDDGVADLTIVEDGRLAMFHAVETFDDVGLPPGRLIADWGR